MGKVKLYLSIPRLLQKDYRGIAALLPILSDVMQVIFFKLYSKWSGFKLHFEILNYSSQAKVMQFFDSAKQGRLICSWNVLNAINSVQTAME